MANKSVGSFIGNQFLALIFLAMIVSFPLAICLSIAGCDTPKPKPKHQYGFGRVIEIKFVKADIEMVPMAIPDGEGHITTQLRPVPVPAKYHLVVEFQDERAEFDYSENDGKNFEVGKSYDFSGRNK